MAGQLRCDLCGVPATTVHVLPGIDSVDRVVLSGECECDPGGYRFAIRAWDSGPPAWGDPSRRYTMRRHSENTRRDSARAITLIDARLGPS
jgi:hypothetical protein